jgi:thiol-disulfide isomerase/thioredoxin
VSNSPNFQKSRTSRRLTPPPAQRALWQAPSAWVLGLLVLATVVTIAITAGGSDSDETRPQTAFAEIIGDALPPLSEPDPAIGRSFPLISAQTLGGDRVTLGNDDIARVFGFFAHWCSHCPAEVPRITSWLQNNELPADVEIVAISTGVESTASNYPPSAWFEREGWPAQVLLDSDSATLASALVLPGYPYWIAVDAEGTLLNRVSGELTSDQFGALVDVAAGA